MLKLVLRVLAIGFVIAGLTHIVLGLGADATLGAHIDPATMADPTLDSQNRYYGASFTIYGALFWYAAADAARHRTLLRILIAWFFFGGLARLVSLAIHGMPSGPVTALAASELLLPPLLWWLVHRDPARVD